MGCLLKCRFDPELLASHCRCSERHRLSTSGSRIAIFRDMKADNGTSQNRACLPKTSIGGYANMRFELLYPDVDEGISECCRILKVKQTLNRLSEG